MLPQFLALVATLFCVIFGLLHAYIRKKQSKVILQMRRNRSEQDQFAPRQRIEYEVLASTLLKTSFACYVVVLFTAAFEQLNLLTPCTVLVATSTVLFAGFWNRRLERAEKWTYYSGKRPKI